jgi:hypothetical protein
MISALLWMLLTLMGAACVLLFLNYGATCQVAHNTRALIDALDRLQEGGS